MALFLEAIRAAATETRGAGWEATVPPDWWMTHIAARQLFELAHGTDDDRMEWARSLFHRK